MRGLSLQSRLECPRSSSGPPRPDDNPRFFIVNRVPRGARDTEQSGCVQAAPACPWSLLEEAPRGLVSRGRTDRACWRRLGSATPLARGPPTASSSKRSPLQRHPGPTVRPPAGSGPTGGHGTGAVRATGKENRTRARIDTKRRISGAKSDTREPDVAHKKQGRTRARSGHGPTRFHSWLQ